MSSHYFIGIPLPESLRERLSQTQQEVEPHVSYKQWTHVEDFHITLTFLGEVTNNKVNDLRKRMRHVSKQVSTFPMTVHGIGFFGKEDQPRVCWAGVEPTNALTTLYQYVSEECEQEGFIKEKRPYRPHITLAKKWKGMDRISHTLTKQVGPPAFDFSVEQFALFRIHPQNQPKYEIVENFTLSQEEE